MGKRGNWRKGSAKRAKKEDTWRDTPEIIDNGNFRKYYEAQQILSPEELEVMIETFKKDLPTTIRINPYEPSYDNIKKRLSTEFKFEKPIEYEGNQIKSIFPLSWYPDEGAWQLDIHRKKVRKVPELKSLHEYIIQLDNSNQISRQEAVSMIPPLMLQAQPGDVVLDMCAAPGSKTIQLIEAVEGNVRRTSKNLKEWMTKAGVVVANDCDAKRAYLLVHRTHSLRSPNVLVTTHLGQVYPNFLNLKLQDGCKIEGLKEGDDHPLVFDRILCDVPCSGDGTLRKTPGLWSTFNPKFGRGLHPLQMRITLRGLALLKVGGTLVYSTCSLNPIEDEAVVAEILRRTAGSVVIKDMSGELTGLKRRPGITKWIVEDNDMNVVESYDKVPADQQRMFRPSMWCGSPEEMEQYHLERCMRFYPHLQDTGGFFVTVLQKVAPLPNKNRDAARASAESSNKNKEDIEGIDLLSEEDDIDIDKEKKEEKDEIVKVEEKVEKKEEEEEEEDKKENEIEEDDDDHDEEEEEEGNKNNNNRKKDKVKQEEKLYKWDGSSKDIIQSFYGIDDSFDWEGLYSRSETFKILTYVSPKIRYLSLGSPSCDKIRLVHAGVRVFERNNNCDECPYRICQDGLFIIKEYMTKRKISVDIKTFVTILGSQKQPITIDAFNEEEKTLLSSMTMGACVFDLNDEAVEILSKKSPNFREYFKEMACVVWKGIKNVNILMAKCDIDILKQYVTIDE
ncbi:hypothetical protein WA158_006048 [Blastocystis sp. Blastoise]